MNCAAGKAHLNISELVALFKTEQANTEVSLAQLAGGGVVKNTINILHKTEETRKK